MQLFCSNLIWRINQLENLLDLKTFNWPHLIPNVIMEIMLMSHERKYLFMPLHFTISFSITRTNEILVFPVFGRMYVFLHIFKMLLKSKSRVGFFHIKGILLLTDSCYSKVQFSLFSYLKCQNNF